MRPALFIVITLTTLLSLTHSATPLDTIRAVGAEGEGNAAASKAWKELIKTPPNRLPEILAAMDGANDLSINWLRSAADVIAERALAKKRGKIPIVELNDFLFNLKHDPRARSLAFELLRRVDAESADALVPQLLNDPSVVLRRKAVQRLMDQGNVLVDAENTLSAIPVFQKALGAARDIDQIKELTERLREMGQQVDLPRLFGFLMHWKVLGPFDNTGRKGFDTVYPPERKIDLSATYPGKLDKVKWQDYVTADEYGMVDLNKPLGMLKEVVGYAYAEFNSGTSREGEIRLGCKNAWKVWLNGELLFARDEYHRGARIDQYSMPAQLKSGKNTILVKLCQNEQEQDWTVEWQCQLRVCDATGTAILSTDRPPTPVPEKQKRRRPRPKDKKKGKTK